MKAKNYLTMNVLRLCLSALIAFGFTAAVAQESGEVLISESFNNLGASWKQIALEDQVGGEVKAENGTLKLSSQGRYFGVYNTRPVSGHFIVDLSFVKDENIGLALIKSQKGKPDTDNYTLLTVDQKQGDVVVRVRDRQNGKANVLDHTGKTDFEGQRQNSRESELNIQPDLYKHVLTGDKYSLPYTQTHKKIRIFREDNAGFFHYYYEVGKEFEGEEYTDWMELRPSPDWNGQGTEFFVALVALHEGTTTVREIKAVRKPRKDQGDRNTGFEVTQREYNWSGFMGDAHVVTFDEAFRYQDQGIKFVFWSEMNYIPAWHLNNQLLYTYEFVETWDEQVPGCHEPMSDRLHRWTRVEVLEDNPVRKVLKWHYVLSNPNYRVPHHGKGEQLPVVNEIWTFYPDGSGTRHIIYKPKLDTDFRAAHELGELISIAGSSSHSSDFYASPALTLRNLKGDVQQAHPGPKFDYYSHIDDWKQQIISVHFQNEPDVFCVWSDDPGIPQTYSGYQIRYENAWQNPDGTIAHWPVNKRPYTSAFSSGGTWKGEVSHASLLSWGVREGIQWEDHYKTDESGRKYREWVSLVGVNTPGDTSRLKAQSRSWLFKGEVKASGGSFIRKNYKKNAWVFQLDPGSNKLEFNIMPEGKARKIVQPALRINHWGSDTDIRLAVNGKQLERETFSASAIEKDALLIWMNTTLQSHDKVVVTKKTGG